MWPFPRLCASFSLSVLLLFRVCVASSPCLCGFFSLSVWLLFHVCVVHSSCLCDSFFMSVWLLLLVCTVLFFVHSLVCQQVFLWRFSIFGFVFLLVRVDVFLLVRGDVFLPLLAFLCACSL